MPSCWKRFLQRSQALLGAAAPLLAAAAAAPLTSKQERKAAKPSEKKMLAIEIQKNDVLQIKDFKHKGFPLKETRRYNTSQNSASTTQQEAQHQSPSKASCLASRASRVWCVVFHGVFHGRHGGGADGADGQSWHNWQMRKGHHAFEDEDVFWFDQYQISIDNMWSVLKR